MIRLPLFQVKAIGVLWLLARTAVAEYRFDVWTADSGLPQNSVRAIVQTRDGYLWIGTLDGLARFDGVRFTVFTKANSPGLGGNRVTALYEDPDGDLWVGLETGGIARYHSGRFTALGTREGLPGGIIGMIAEGERRRPLTFIGTAAFQWTDNKFLPALQETRTLFSPHHGGLLCGNVEDGFQIFFRGKLTTLSLSNGLPSLGIKAITADQYGNWWLTAEEGLVKARDGKVVKIFTPQDGLPMPLRSSALDAIACEDRKGNIWINGAGPWLGRLKDGVLTGYPSSNTLSSQPLPLAVPGVAAGYIKALFEDREGNLWIGTEGNGLIRAREQIVNVISTGQGLHAANIYPVYEDRAGAVWLGSWWRGPARLKSGVITNFDFELDMTAFCEDRTGRLWLGTIGGLAFLEDDKLKRDGIPETLRHAVNAICEDRNGVLWIGSEHGLFSCARGAGSSSFVQPDGFPPSNISVIIEDRAGALWIGGRAGLTRFSKGQFTTWTDQDGLPSNYVVALYEDDAGAIWIGTADSGLGRFKQGRFTRYTTSEGLFDNGVFQILEDVGGNFWMSCNRGIYRVSKRELNEVAEGNRRTISSVVYGKGDGMLSAECNGGRWPAGIKTRDGRLWFPTQDGVAVIDPTALRSNTNPPPVVIESFVVDRQPQPLDLSLRVPPHKANIEIQYSGLSFINSDRISFKYRLTPTDKQWVEAGTRRTAYFSHLAPGHYTFSVLAANSDGIWSPTGASLPFVILPAWYQTWLARMVGSAALAGLLFAAYRLRVNQLENARAMEQEFSHRLMESQEQERQRLAAELHDSVGQSLLVIKNRAVMALEHPEKSGKMSEHIAELSNVASSALREVRSMAQDLRPFQLDEMGLTKAILAMTRRLGDSSRIQFHTDITDLNGELPKDREIHFYRVIQELLTNIVKHSKATEGRLTIRKAGPMLRALIQDNGCGFDIGASVAQPPTQTGFGLHGIRERVRTLGGRLQLNSQAGEGTSVVIEVPIEY